MKRILFILLILSSVSSAGQITQKNGNVGISKAIPAYKLDVNGTINSTLYRLNGVVQYFTTTGAGTCKIGFQSGYSETESAARYNVFAGYSSGYTNISGTNNVIIGKSAGYLSTGSNNIFIGSEAGTFTTKSNRIIIGSMQNSASAAQDTTKNIIYALQNLNPIYNKLTVNGSLNVTGNIYKNNNPIDLWTLNNSRLTYQIYNDFEGDSAFTIFDNPGGLNVIKINTLDQTIVFDDAEQGDYQVGINTRTPAYTLDVNGTTNISGDLIVELPHVSVFRKTDLTISATQNIWYKITGFTTKDVGLMTVIGDSIQLTKAGHYLINYSASFSGLNNEIWEIGIFKNGALEDPSQLRYTSSSDVGNANCPVSVSSDGNDWISFKIRNTVDNDDPTIKRFSGIISTIHLE